MEAIEFQAFVGKDGIIKVPESLSKKIKNGKVRVIVLGEDRKPFSREEIYDRRNDRIENFIEFLLKNPVKVYKSISFLNRDELHDRKL